MRRDHLRSKLDKKDPLLCLLFIFGIFIVVSAFEFTMNVTSRRRLYNKNCNGLTENDIIETKRRFAEDERNERKKTEMNSSNCPYENVAMEPNRN